MKKFMIALMALLTLTVNANAMSYSQARDQALFLTDKMAYELNLTEEQYEAAYEVNLDYLMSINTYDDLYGTYWTNRNLDLSYILMDWQYRAFCAASYFYRPLYWDAGIWHFSIYARYPHRSYFYFGRPGFYDTYRGGHGWRFNGGRSWYRGRDFNHGYIARGNGMKDRFERGDFNRGGNRSFNRGDMNRPGRNDGNRFDRNNNRFDRGNNSMDRNNGNRFDRNDSRFNRNNNNGNNGFNRQNNSGQTQRFTPGSVRNGNTTNQGVNRSTPRRGFNNSNSGERVNRESSTRTTVQPNRMLRNGQSQYNSSRNSQRNLPTRPSNTFTPRSNSNSSQSFRSAPSRSSGSSNGMTRSSGGSNHNSGGGSSHGGGGHFGGRH